MNRTILLCMVVVLSIVMVITGCVETKTRKSQTLKTEGRRVPSTLAIFPFENNSVTEPAKYEPLKKGLSAMLITDLIQKQSSLKIIERDKIESILKEISLSQSGSVDEATAIQAGRLLGAQSIAFGSFIVMGSNVRIDSRIINVETSELIMAESIMGSSSDFMNLERGLAEKIADSLDVSLKAEKTTESSIEAAVYFSKGIEAHDRGDRVEAKKMFEEKYPSYPGDVGVCNDNYDRCSSCRQGS
jgi:TolB-like protein